MQIPCKPPRSCPHDLATTDPTRNTRLSIYDTRGKHGCVTPLRQEKDLLLVSEQLIWSTIHRLQGLNGRVYTGGPYNIFAWA